MVEFADKLVDGSLVVLGIGLLIFVHELGHFLVAKKVGIRVEAFSLGFGPKLWGFQRGETLYKISAVPLGGYVKMSGEMPGEEVVGDGREFSAKTITQRVAVVSAGVVMNVIFAFVAFPVAFSLGVPFNAPSVGHVIEGMPAWKADVRAGDEIVQINGNDVIGFSDLRMAAAFSSDPIDLVLDRDGKRIERRVHPEYGHGVGFHQVGVETSWTARPKEGSILVERYGLSPDDTVVAIEGMPIHGRYDLSSALTWYVDGAVELTVRDADGSRRKVTVDCKRKEGEEGWMLGVAFANLRVESVLKAADVAGLEQLTVAERLGLAPGDVITRVNGDDVYTVMGVRRAMLALAGGGDLVVTVRRGDEPPGTVELRTQLEPGEAPGLLTSFTSKPEGARLEVSPHGPSAGVVKNGEWIIEANGKEIARTEGGIDDLRTVVRESEGKAIQLRLSDRPDEVVTVTPTRPLSNGTLQDGLAMMAVRTKATVPFPRSLVVGSKQAVHQFWKIIMTIRSLIVGDVSARNMGGIITISVVSYHFADEGLAKILFFMAILSLNLAILNILPIPVLDGGHLVFLALEWIKGEPVSERVMGWANIVGLVLILGLMAFVTFNDLDRFVFN